ncbi:hypothetical protein Q8A73_018077 [Channa argus]|nr:hypothetical protein Q8A73_018077 [Channa argus]
MFWRPEAPQQHLDTEPKGATLGTRRCFVQTSPRHKGERKKEASVNVVLHVGVSAEEEAAAKVTPNPTQEPHLSLGSPPVCLQYQDKDPSQPAPETDPHPHLPPNFRAAEDPCARMHSNKIETYMKKTVRGRRPEPHNVPYSLKTDDSHEMSCCSFLLFMPGLDFLLPALADLFSANLMNSFNMPTSRLAGGGGHGDEGGSLLVKNARGLPVAGWVCEPADGR